MKCSNCTTELWGRPAVCPVCGTPTGLNRRSSRQTPPPWTPAAPAAPPPAPSQPQPFFNAADLLDPAVLDAVPQAPANVGIFSTAPLAGDPPAAEAQPGMINAVDLFDPEVLADLTGSAGEGRSGQSPVETPEQEDYPAFDEEAEDGYQDTGGNYRQAPAPPRMAPRPIAPPLFSLTALPTTAPQPSVPPAPPPPPFPSRDYAPAAPSMPPEEEERDWRPQRGYSIAAGPPPVGVPTSRPAMPPPGMYPAGPYMMPAPPPSKVGAPPPKKGRGFFNTLGGLLTLLLVLAIIGIALLIGATRLFQLQALEPKLAQTTPASLPTVAPKAGYTIIPDHTLGFSLQYDNSWQETADHDASDAGYRGDLFQAGPNDGFEVGSSPQYAGWSPAQIDDYILGNPFPLMPNVASTQTFVPASPTIHIDNLDWTAEDADLTLTNGINLRITCLAILHNGHGYAIFYFAPQEVFSNEYAQYFEPMLLSFRFLNG
jgi:hypothetical protein